MLEIAAETIDGWIEITSGAAFSSKYFSLQDGLPLVRIRDLGKGSTATRYNGPYDPVFLLQSGDVLIGMDGDFSVERWEGGTALLNQRVCKVTSRSDELDQGFLYHFLKPHIADIHRVTPETTVRHLSTKDLRKIARPQVAPASQKLIAAFLDAIDDAILEADAVIEKLRTVRIGLTDDLLTRGLANDGSPRDLPTLKETAVGSRPATWTVANLGRFVAGAEYGTNLSLGDSSAGIPVLRMNNIQDGEFDLSDLKYAPAHAVERFRVQRNDVLFNRTNSWEHVGKAAIWRRDEPGPAFASYLVRLHCSQALLPEFLHLWLNWAPVQRSIRQFATPGVQQVNINPTNLRRALIAVPDTLEEQHAIIERVNSVAAAIEDHRRQRVKLSSIREGLRDDLLTGRKPVAAIREAAE